MTHQYFSIYALNIINADYGDDVEDFSIYIHCEVSRRGTPGGETFGATVVSPDRLKKNCPTLGRGIVVAQHYDEKEIIDLLNPLVSESLTWDEVTRSIALFFDWID